MLEKAGYEAYVVGGAVRDFLLGKKPHDFDITTSAKPEETEEVFKDFLIAEHGLKHGTILVVVNGMPIEITTFRTDGDYSDKRHPDTVAFTTDLSEDLARRDFTVNALAYSPAKGIIDLFGGIEDMNNKVLRAVGDPEERFTEDALRIARAVRFCAQLGFRLEENTEKAAFKLKEYLKDIAVERFSAELIKTLCSPGVEDVLLEYHEILEVLIPEITPMVGFDQHNKHHIYDVWTHTVKVVSAIEPKPSLRLAALLHDSGKPHTFTTDEKGQGHFYGHYAVSYDIASTVFRRLKLDRASTDYALQIIRRHDHYLLDNERQIKRVISRFGEEYLYDMIKFQKADNLAQNPEYRYRQAELDKVKETADRIIEGDSCLKLKDLEINGHDLIEAGIPEGPLMGDTLYRLLYAVMDGKVENNKEALIAKAKEWHTTE